MQITQFITTRYHHLTEITRLLFGPVCDALLDDPKHPLVVSIEGTNNSGKKLIPDTVRGDKLPDAPRLGRDNIDEYWRGEYEGRPLEIDFMNASYVGFYFSEFIRTSDSGFSWETGRVEAFLNQRQHGGISFIHNCNVLPCAPDIKITLEERRGYPNLIDQAVVRNNVAYCAKMETLEDPDARQNWVRYFQISVGDRLTGIPDFAAVFNQFAPRYRDEIPSDATLPVYGVDFQPVASPGIKP